jgi:GST-like protein
MPIISYAAPRSSASPVTCALRELDVPHERVNVDLAKGEQRKPEYLALNPNGKVPLLVVDGTPLFESVAILPYLGDRFGAEKGLWPAANDPARLIALSWVAWSTAELGAANVRYLALGGRDATDERAAGARAQVEATLRLLDDRLTGRPFVLGDAFSLVDVALASAAAWINRSAGIDLARFPRVAAWVDVCHRRPALAATMAP